MKTMGEGGLIAETFFGQLTSFISYLDSSGDKKF
jgi:hypothetical protein